MSQETAMKDFIAILDDVMSLCCRWNRGAQITLIGGDPLLHSGFESLAEILANTPSVRIIVAGNPETLSPRMIEWLKPRIFAFQVSVDGNEQTHDWFRYSGSYRNTINRIKEASQKGLRMHVMTTVSKENVGQLVDIMHTVYDEAGAHRWAFARYVPPVGEKLDLDPLAYRNALAKVETAHLPYLKANYDPQRKDPLWYPFRNSPPNSDDNPKHCQVDGCGIGSPTLAVLPDNTVMACRRHAGSTLGKWEKKGDILQFLIFSRTMKQLRQLENIEGCKDCPYLYCCRGCRAIAYAVRGCLTDPDPTCPIL